MNACMRPGRPTVDPRPTPSVITMGDMSAPDALRRSVLYVPASNDRAMVKAAGLAADVILLDLEDAVAPDVKLTARVAAVAAVGDGRFGDREVAIRVNGLDTPWGTDDLLAVAASDADAVVLPKIDSPADIDVAVRLLAAANAAPALAVWPMIETPAGFLDCRAIAAHPRVAALVIGTNDLAFALRADISVDRSALVPHLAHALLAARATGTVIIDGAHTRIGDDEGLRDECRQGRAMGFDGKTVTHPSQIAIVNETWSPSVDEVERARGVVAAFDAAVADGSGVAVVDGRLIENLHAAEARRTIAIADACAARDRR